MKKTILVLLIIIPYSFIVNAQSLDKALEQLEIVQEKKGEVSIEYLTALDSVIQYASLSDNLGIAITFRKRHLDIVKQMKGESCVEVADDLWRLGNTTLRTEDSLMALKYYQDAAAIFESTIDKSINNSFALHYRECLYSISELSQSIPGITPDYSYTLRFYKLCKQILENEGNTNAYEYYITLVYLFGLASNLGEDQTVLETAPKLESLIPAYSDNPIIDEYDFTSIMYSVCARVGKFDEALSYTDKSMELAVQIKGDSCWVEKADYAFSKAQLYQFMGEKQNAIYWINEGKTYLNKIQDKTISCFLLTKFLSLEGKVLTDSHEALAKFDSVLCILSRMIDSTETITNQYKYPYYEDNPSDSYIEAKNFLLKFQKDYAGTLIDKGILLVNNGNLTQAYDAFIKSAEIWEKVTTTSSEGYITCQHNIAVCQMRLGHYADAINTIDKVSNIVYSYYGNLHPLYVSCLLNYSVYYNSVSDFDKVIEYCEEAATISQKIGMVDLCLKAMINLCSGYLSKENYSKAQTIMQECIDIIENHDLFFPDIYKMYNILAVGLFGTNQTKKGQEYFDKSKILIESTYGKESIEYAEWAICYGGELTIKNNNAAFDYYSDAMDFFIRSKNKHHPLYFNSLFHYGYSGQVNDKALIDNYIPLMIEATKDYYSENISYYSTSDRDYLWGNIQSNTTSLIFTSRTNSLFDIFLYDYLLFEKGLLLSTSNSFKNTIFKSGRQNLIDQYNNIQAVQRAIDMQSFGLPTETQPQEMLNEKKISMERNLIAEMKELGYSQNDSITYSDVSRSLKSNEIAIEFVDYYHLKDEKTYYVALLAKTTWDKPVYVQLCTEDELKACMGNPNVTYSTDDLYRLLWQPLLDYVDDSCTVYFSLSGMLHTIALESLHAPDGSCLIEKYNMVRLTSTRELCKEKQPKVYETGTVYGGLQYDVEQQRMAEVAAMNKTELEESPAFALRGEDRGNWNYLQGTKDEAEHIAGIMRTANINCNLFEGDLGSEESFKALSGSNTDIIHLATHGYFLEGEKADMNDFMNSLSPLARQKTNSVIDPLLRSGLILSGGNSAWLGKEVPNGVEDGVLTALEISTMDLSGTDMVVMSACETGLGDITSDGVFGLQRAFKMAGVQTLVMSLWKVDDNATSLMMQTFYEHLLSGKSKREAFGLAQAAVREKYLEPYYWAGFIMLD